MVLLMAVGGERKKTTKRYPVVDLIYAGTMKERFNLLD